MPAHARKLMHHDQPRHGSPKSKARVLLVEDDPDFRHFLASELARSGFEVMQLTNGYDFADYVATLCLYPVRRPDVIITDVRMPGYDGLKILSGIRSAQWETPVILMTAFGDQDVVDEARSNDAVTVFSKPFDLSQFKTCVENVIYSERERRAVETEAKRALAREMRSVP